MRWDEMNVLVIPQRSTGAAGAAAAVAAVAFEGLVYIRNGMESSAGVCCGMVREKTHSPPFTELVPKFPPTAPAQVHDFPAELVQRAVAVAPTLRQVTEAWTTAAVLAKRMRVEGRIVRE
jgi:hypothetical protein